MNKKLLYGVIAIIVILIATGAGYHYYSLPSTPTTSSNKVLTIALTGDPVSLDPQYYRMMNPDLTIITQICETLFTYNATIGGLQPLLATGWTRVDNVTIRITLRQGVKFHDGTPFNASAVVFVINRLRDVASWPARVASIKSAEAQDNYNVLLHLYSTTPSLVVLQEFTHGSVAIVSPSAVQKMGNASFALSPVGTGPFKFVEWKRNQYVTIEKNTNYWGSPAQLDKIIFKIIPDAITRYMALQAGEVNAIYSPPTTQMAQLQSNQTFKVWRTPSLRVLWLAFNLAKPLWQDANVREAVMLAINRTGIVINVVDGLGIIANGYLANATAQHVEFTNLRYDPTEAKVLLASAGWVPGAGGILTKGGQSFKITIISPSGLYPMDLQVMEAIQAQLRAVGIDGTVQTMDTATYNSQVQAALSPPATLQDIWLDSRMNYVDGWQRLSMDLLSTSKWDGLYLKDPNIDNLIKISQNELNSTLRDIEIKEVQYIVARNYYLVPLYEAVNIYAMTKNVQNWNGYTDYLYLSNVYISG